MLLIEEQPFESKGIFVATSQRAWIQIVKRGGEGEEGQ